MMFIPFTGYASVWHSWQDAWRFALVGDAGFLAKREEASRWKDSLLPVRSVLPTAFTEPFQSKSAHATSLSRFHR